MILNIKRLTFIGLVALAVPIILVGRSHASDHADTPDIAANPGADITDVYVFPSPTNSENVVFAMNVHPLVGAGKGKTTRFDPNIIYQFKIDTDGDGVEDEVMQAKFFYAGLAQKVQISGPVHPSTTGTANNLEKPYSVTGEINKPFSPTPGMTVFAGGREDPFFFDLEQFFTIFPDRATPLNGIPVADPNTPKAGGWRAPGAAKDFLTVNKLNVLSIVIEVPKRLL